MSCHKLGTKKKFWVSTRNQTSELWILLSDTLPLSHRDSMVSEVDYEEVYYEVTFSIPPGDLEFFLCSTFQTRQKHLSLVRWKFKRGQLFAALHRFENSSNIDAAIQIFLYLSMSRFYSQSLYNICTVRRWLYVSRVFSHLHLITW